MTSRRSLLRFMTLVAACGAVSSRPSTAAAQAFAGAGTLTIVWVDPRTGRPPPPQFHFLSDAGERWVLEGVTPEMLRLPVGRVGLRVRISGTPSTPAPRQGRAATQPKLRVQSIQSAGGFLLQAPAIRLGVERYVTLQCLLPGLPANDMPGEPVLQRWLGTGYPSVGQVMTEMSRSQYSVDGSEIAGPYLLPGTLESYVPGGSTNPDLILITETCLSLADPEVDFSQVAGVNIQYNYSAPAAYGGGVVLSRDGPARVVGATWMPSWASSSVYVHEVGHSIGWPHSGGPYGSPYDSCWDVMSSPYCFYDPAEATWIPRHTIAVHRGASGWIPGDRLVILSLGAERQVRIAASGAPIAPGAVELVELERTLGLRLLVEARRRQGAYESYIPASGIVLHERTGGDAAQVIDVDGNGNPNDDAATWLAGEVYEDSAAGSRLEIQAAHPDGSFDVLATAGWRLAAEVAGQGALQVDGVPCASPCVRVSPVRGTQYLVGAVPATGKVLARWEGDCTGTSPCAVTMNGTRRVRAVFGTPLVISSTGSRPYGVAGTSYRDDLAATGGDGPVSWRVVSGALPQGLTLSATGTVSGTLVRSGRSTVEIEVASTLTTARATFTFDVFDPVTIHEAPTRAAVLVGRVLEVRFTGTGGGGTLTWSVVTGQLPAGIAIDPATGTLGGTPVQSGVRELVIEARWDTLAARVPLTLEVLDRLAITSDSVRPAARMGATVHDTLRAVPGDLARWTLTAGALPSGVSLSEAGVVSGMAAEAGTFSFTAQAALEPDTARRVFAITVTKPALSDAGVTGQLLGGGPALTEDERQFLDLLGNRNGRVDLADVRAWLVDSGRLPASSSAADAMATLRPKGGSR